MCTAEPPFIGKRQTRRTDCSLTVLSDHYGFRSSDNGAYGGQGVKDQRSGPMAQLPHAHAAKLSRHADAGQISEDSISRKACADEHDRFSSMLTSRELHLSK